MTSTELHVYRTTIYTLVVNGYVRGSFYTEEDADGYAHENKILTTDLPFEIVKSKLLHSSDSKPETMTLGIKTAPETTEL